MQKFEMEMTSNFLIFLSILFLHNSATRTDVQIPQSQNHRNIVIFVIRFDLCMDLHIIFKCSSVFSRFKFIN